MKKPAKLFGALALAALAVGVLGATPADAHTPSATANCATGVTLNLTNYEAPNSADSVNNDATVYLDGKLFSTIPFASELKVTIPWQAKAATHTYKVVVDANIVKGNPTKYDTVLEGSVTGCPAPEPVVYSLTTSHTVECGAATITLRNQSPWVYGVTVTVDGQPYKGTPYNLTVSNGTPSQPGPVNSDKSGSLTITFPEDSGEHTITYKVAYGSENKLYVGQDAGTLKTITVASDCVDETTTTTTPPDETTTTLGEIIVDCDLGYELDADGVRCLPEAVETSAPTTSTRPSVPPVVPPCVGICGPATVATTTPATPITTAPVTTAVAPAGQSLPATGNSPVTLIALALGALVLGGAGLAASRRS